MAVLNAANEVAVEQFLDGRIGFNEIARLIARVMEDSSSSEADSLEKILQADASARALASEIAGGSRLK